MRHDVIIWCPRGHRIEVYQRGYFVAAHPGEECSYCPEIVARAFREHQDTTNQTAGGSPHLERLKVSKEAREVYSDDERIYRETRIRQANPEIDELAEDYRSFASYIRDAMYQALVGTPPTFAATRIMEKADPDREETLEALEAELNFRVSRGERP